MRRLNLLALLATLVLCACSPKHEDPQLFTYQTPLITGQSALLHAQSVGGLLFAVADTHSMEPVIRGGDTLVVVKTPYADLRAGQVITYYAVWNKSSTVTHRLAMKDSSGWILSGDNVSHYENEYRVDEAHYIGKVIAIYRTVP